MQMCHQWRRLDVGHFVVLIDTLTWRPPRAAWPGRSEAGEFHDRYELHVEGQSSSRTLAMKGPSIELSTLIVSAIITLVLGEWWHWVPVIAAIVVVRVLRR